MRPGWSRPLVRTLSIGMGTAPASEASTTTSSLVTT
jgi:hypothetical protein